MVVIDEFGIRIAALRQSFGFSQSELAYRSGVSKSAIEKIESGRRVATMSTARRLVAVLGHSLELRPTTVVNYQPTRPLRPCGTPAAVARHRYHGEPLCPACKRWDRDRKRAARSPQAVDKGGEVA